MESTVDARDGSTIPVPIDDGATRHPIGARMASVSLPRTDGGGTRGFETAIAGRRASSTSTCGTKLTWPLGLAACVGPFATCLHATRDIRGRYD